MSYRSIFRPGLFDGQVAIVTGGGSGIGRCTAHELAALGARVALVGRKLDKLKSVEAEIVARGGLVSCHAIDIRDEASVQLVIGDVLATHGRIDALVNNAGGQFPMPLAAMSLNGWEAVVKTNLTGGFLMARESFGQWMSQHGGAIVNIVADMWGSMPMMGHSGAARAGMVSFTETAAVEWAAAGVRVNAVAPGYIASSGLEKYPPEFASFLKKAHTSIPAYRLGTESEISAAIVYLLSEAASFITGAVLRVDGGRPNGRIGWEPVAHDKSRPFNGFDLAQPPKILGGE
ncbi:SDR family oxidoreductase [Chitinivorax sp. PXF-14]|uniref:SDR family oxidoreductase n=1 Tax=Chitinivorax sp. PXF-14 TaxID=3230488 RepID=UPI0034671AC6